MFEEKIKSILLEVIKNKLNGGCIYKAVDDNITYATVFDCNAVVNKLLEPVLDKLRRMRIQDIDKNNTKIIKVNISRDLKIIKKQVANGNCNNICICGTTISLPFILTAKLQNGKIIERNFGIKENGQQYTQEEIKVILKEAEEVECDEKFKDSRVRKYSLLSMIVDIDTSILRGQYPLRVIAPDNKDKDKVYEEIKQTINKAKKDPNSPNILLIPYSADGHIVTLLVDKNEFPESNSVICFDSSHYFTGYIGWIKERFGREGKPFKEKHFSFELYGKLKDNKKPINDKIIQGLEGTCSFYTEAFCYLVSKYIQDKKNEGVDLKLDDISNHINSKEFIKQLKDKKEEFFNEYKATMEEVKQKQEQQKENIKQEIIKYKKQSSLQNEQLTPDEQHYQQLLNQYGICMYGQEFMDDINGIDGINNSNSFNPDQQNALVQEFIGSDVITRLNGGREIIVGFNHNREAFMNIIHDARQPNSVLNGGTAPVNFIYTLGTERNQNPDAGTHYVAAQIFRHPITNELVVLHYDSLNGTMSDEFERYIRNEFGENIQIVNISNQGRFTQRNQGGNTCGLCALTALRPTGILDQERIRKCHMSKDDININMYDTPQQTQEQVQLSEVYRGLDIEASSIPPQREQNQPLFQTLQTPPLPPPTPNSSTPSMGSSNN